MNSIKHILLFIKNNGLQLKRKWFSLPLLFFFPIIAVVLVILIVASFFLPNENNPIRIGIVDLDQSTETQMVTQLIEDSTQLGNYVEADMMEEEEAQTATSNNEISAYLIFPKQFTNDLYNGNSVELPVIGNPRKPMESLLIHEIIGSVVRHIRASQANISTINEYAKELEMSDTQRNDLILEQFQEFVLYTLGSNQIVNENEVTNQATSSPIQYFTTGALFIILTTWLLAIYNYLHANNSKQIKQRMYLYGVTELQQIIAKMFVTLITVFLFSVILLVIILESPHFDFEMNEWIKITLISLFYSISLLSIFGILEVLTVSYPLRLLCQSFLALVSILISGAVIPVIYFPFWLQDIITYAFPYEAFYWLTEIILHNRIYTDYLPLLMITLAAVCTLAGVSLGKERIKP
ncbi:ABC transporter permease [Oceanobacillus salinisoli]|uniref:ABC transporter permease n=1 Tax=Oceanobacillus salinisoli TaxID=2678611 RepID=UPI0012E22A71|nr:ABC transporter permease [Oceanobacillus salinisoli]